MTDSLTRAVLETERHVSQNGWDQPARLFALVRTAALLQREPALAAQLSPGAPQAAHADPGHLTAVEQEGLPDSESLEGMLAQVAWGADVDGVCLTVERVVLPPEAETDVPDDPGAALDYLMQHPSRADVRLVVGVLRDGQSICALRQRQHDDPGSVAVGPDLVPGLVAALQATLED
ncbi:MAG TPA: PPA1309 family protein [Actinomycetales bacterium]|nr:PPA1309 family protein [Actinomycetales bacterium]